MKEEQYGAKTPVQCIQVLFGSLKLDDQEEFLRWIDDTFTCYRVDIDIPQKWRYKWGQQGLRDEDIL